MWLNISVTDWVSMVSNLAVGISAIIVALTGIRGLQAWKQEARWKAKFELAQYISDLINTYSYQFQSARNPVTRTHATETEGTTSATVSEYQTRLDALEPLRQTVLELMKSGWRVRILLGSDVEVQLQALVHSYSDLSTAIRIYFSMVEMQSVKPTIDFFTSDLRVTAESRVYEHEDDDEFGKRVADIVDDLTIKLGKVMLRE